MDLVHLAEKRMDEYGPADAVLNYWDFPGSCLAPLLCHRNGLPGPKLEAVAALEHKYWARVALDRVAPEASTQFCAVDPFAERPRDEIEIDYPFWVKPFVSHSSYLGFKVENEEQLKEAMGIIREGIGLFGDPFNEFLEHVDLPPEIAGIGGNHCIAEQSIAADAQVTLEGYVFSGEVVVYGAVDSVREGGVGSSFSRYQYPSRMPREVLEKMEDVTRKLLTEVGYDNAPFNVEFFYDEETGRISLLEVNTRISKSHAPLFQDVDGASHQKIALDLALGHRPHFPHGEGRWPSAAKFMLRLFQDGQVKRMPSSTEIHHMQARYPEAMVQVLVEEGQRLSHMRFQDSYSFEIADIFIGGDDQEELLTKYSDMLENLPFEIDLTAPVPK
jgi:biotin carboxylase